MPVRVHIPSLLRHLYSTQPIEIVEASTVAEMAAALEARFPGIRERLLEPDGRLRRYVDVFIEGEDARGMGGAAAPIRPDVEVRIVPNVAGGSGDGTADAPDGTLRGSLRRAQRRSRPARPWSPPPPYPPPFRGRGQIPNRWKTSVELESVLHRTGEPAAKG